MGRWTAPGWRTRQGPAGARVMAEPGSWWPNTRPRERPRRPPTGNVTGERTCGLQADCGRAALGAGRRTVAGGSTARPAGPQPVARRAPPRLVRAVGEEGQLQPGWAPHARGE